ncbi:sigma-E factor negative regulatory protein [Brackiella oedipodis]|uniref:sigma-E factor negative regulatory protein n=1 Tax=Brackiella oedipodis TaxID=124225 RepID=UPI00048B5052|nr:sigma-E factor negative regulatory protein [Brackiella oedipodis]
MNTRPSTCSEPESFSAFIDNECFDFDPIALNAQQQENWYTYHLIGDALRSQSANVVCSSQFVARLHSELDKLPCHHKTAQAESQAVQLSQLQKAKWRFFGTKASDARPKIFAWLGSGAMVTAVLALVAVIINQGAHTESSRSDAVLAAHQADAVSDEAPEVLVKRASPAVAAFMNNHPDLPELLQSSMPADLQSLPFSRPSEMVGLGQYPYNQYIRAHTQRSGHLPFVETSYATP